MAASLGHARRPRYSQETGRNATAPGFKSAAREYACREAIRLGEREARTAKQPQGPVRGEKEDVVFTSCFGCFQKNL